MKELQHLNKYFFKYRYKLLSGVIITIIARIFLLFTPELVGSSVDVIDEYRKGIITDLSEVKSQLLLNILYIVGAAIIGGADASKFGDYDAASKTSKTQDAAALKYLG